jgi:hypothetical protein
MLDRIRARLRDRIDNPAAIPAAERACWPLEDPPLDDSPVEGTSADSVAQTPTVPQQRSAPPMPTTSGPRRSGATP